ncbi:MAG: mechanosensitive ion channel family protein [Gemmatimonadetes bacterium]|nr:mechanosensitive ion channel family protein [Gemmatimonadota bacterium]
MPLQDTNTPLIDPLATVLASSGIPEAWAPFAAGAVGVAVIAVLALLADVLTKRLLLRIVAFFVGRSSTDWDDVLQRHRVFRRLARVAPALVVYLLAPWFFAPASATTSLVQQAASAYMLIMVALAIDAGLNASLDIYRTFEISERVTIRWLVQVFKIALYIVGAIFLLSILMNRNPGFFLGGIGAMTAVLMLIFKDSILGFVAGIQLSANQMVRVGDWIEMPQYGADGDVLDVALTTVKVQNWDKTITTIPTYSLISTSFKNWRGMSESGGRRIKRALNIDMSSVRFCDEDMLERYAKIQFIRDYLERLKQDVRRYNEETEVDDASLVNGRRLTNLGTFRAYVLAYLRNHPKIHQEMTLLVRQLAPTDHGVPIEVYAFSADTAWANYEALQADIFDHLLASLREFDLRVFQHPSGTDVLALRDLSP